MGVLQSCSNKAEATAVATVVRRLIKAGLTADSIGKDNPPAPTNPVFYALLP